MPIPASGQAVLAILGGSSAFTPGLASALADAARDLPPLEVRLQGRNRERLEAVAQFCNRHVRARSIPHEYQYTTSIEEAAKDARVVINQMRIGSWQGRSNDELFPLKFGYPGDETIGPGGLASAIRGMPVVLDAARKAQKVSPQAWFINMSNPMGILLAGLNTLPGLRSLGLCELPALTLETAVALLGLDPDQAVESDYLGLNHQGWFVRLRESGKDLLPALFEKVGEPEAARFFRVDPDVMKGMHALPLPYMRLFYHTEREVAKLRALARSRGEELSDLSQNLFDHYGKSNDPALPDLLKGRGLKWFKMALVPALAALLGGGERLLYVTEKNGKDIPGLPEEAVVEKKCMLGPGGTTLLPFHGPAPERDGPLEPFLQFLRKVVHFEEAALAASLEPVEPRVIDALMAHPIATDEAQARLLAPHVLASMSDGADERSTGSDGADESSILSDRAEDRPTREEEP